MPVIEHYYFPNGYDAENTQWVCVWTNRSSCRANLSDDLEIAIETLEDFGTIYVNFAVIGNRELVVSLRENEVSIQPEGDDAVAVELVIHTWISDINRQKYGEHYQAFSFVTDVVDDSPSFVLEIPTILVNADDFDIGAVKMIRKSRVELDTSLLAAPW